MNTFRRAFFSLGLAGLLQGCNPDYGIFDRQLPPPAEIQPICSYVDSFYQPIESDGLDILMVVDRSCSMNSYQDQLMTGVESVIGALGYDEAWRLLMITTEPTESRYLEEFPLVPGDGMDRAIEMYETTMGSSGSNEKGIESARVYLDDNPHAETWLDRFNAGLIVTFVSDEEDYSPIPLQYAETQYSDDEKVALGFVDFLSWQRPLTSIASIVNPKDGLCDVSEANIGDRYNIAAEAYGGVKVDICSDSWSNAVVGAVTSMLPQDDIALKHVPIERSIDVLYDNELVSQDLWGYDREENKVVFNERPPYGALVEVAYALETCIDPEY